VKMRDNILFIHPTGNPNVKNAVKALHDKGLNCYVSTGFVYKKEFDKYLSFIPLRVRKVIENKLYCRAWLHMDRVHFYSNSSLDLFKFFILRMGVMDFSGLKGQYFNDLIYRNLDEVTSRRVVPKHLLIKAIYAYEDCAASSFEFFKKQGTKCFYELPIMHYKKKDQIMSEERERWPELKHCVELLKEPRWKIDRKDKEIALADHIIVAATVTKDSLIEHGINEKRISVIPYGAPVEYFHPEEKTGHQFRVIFVGIIGIRKGVHYLLKAWTDLKLTNAQLILVGSNVFPKEWLQQYMGKGILYYPSVHHKDLQKFYASSDVFVFPSLAEGFGLVLLEAMACGLPVITTPNTAGPDIVDEGQDGFIVPIRDVEALKEKILWCHDHPHELAQMKKNSRQKAEKLSWNVYRDRLGSKVVRLLT
jgi:starch synthase